MRLFEMNETTFTFDDGVRSIPIAQNEPTPTGEDHPRIEYVAVSAEQRLTMIAIEAAGARWLWRRARKAAFETAMQKAELLIGNVVCPHYQGDKRDLEFYRNYIRALLRL